MSATGLDVFDKTLQTTHIWLDELMAKIRPVESCNATQAVFRLLSRHVNPGQIDKVRQSLPGEVQANWLPVTPDTQVEVEWAISQTGDIAAGGGHS